MPTAPTPIPPFPSPPPTSTDPANFDPRADATVAWFTTGCPGIDAAAQNTYNNAVETATNATAIAAAAAVAADAAGMLAQSNSTVTVGAGNNAFHFVAAKPGLAVVNKRLVAIQPSDPSIRIFGTVASSPAPTSTDITLTSVTSDLFGSGTYSSWELMDAAFLQAAATAFEIWAGITDAAAVTPKGLKDAVAANQLTDNPTIAWDIQTKGVNPYVILGASGHTVGAPTNLFDGMTISLEVVQDATGNRTVNWNSIWDFGTAGLPFLQTGANKADRVFGIYNARRSKIDASFRRGA